MNDSKIDMVRVEINTEVEAYPMLSIREEAPHERRSEIEIPAPMLARLNEADRQVHLIELEIMRYVGARYPFGAIREWLDDNDEVDQHER